MYDFYSNITKYLLKSLPESERKEVVRLIQSDEQWLDGYKKTKIAWALMLSGKKADEYQTEQAYHQLKQRLQLDEKNNRSLHGRRFFLSYAAVAAVLLGVIFYLSVMQFNSRQQQELKYVTTIVADKGQLSSVILPDSTRVWLNSGSTLQYDNHYSVNNRKLTLIGHGSFKVRKNADLPMIVEAGPIKVRVLGTEFDLSAYPEDDQLRVVLQSGKIDYTFFDNDKRTRILKPGQMAVFDKRTNQLRIDQVTASSASVWKEGALVFRKTPMHDVLNQLSRKYKVDFAVNDSSVYRSVLNASFKHEDIREILDYIQFSCPVYYSAGDGPGRYMLSSKQYNKE